MAEQLDTGRLGIIGGTSFLEGPLIDEVEESTVSTDRGDVVVHLADDLAFVCRHGHGGVYHPPHRIPHHAHVLAFESLGIRRVVGMNSVGGLDRELDPGTAVVAGDYLSVHPPPTFAGDERLHVVPALDEELRALLLSAAKATEGPVRADGVYVQTHGPRFETRAEIRMLRNFGDVIGMTAASEATLFQERGIGYAMLGIVDNYANGIVAEPLTFEAFENQRKANQERARQIVGAILRRHRGEEPV